MELDDTNHRSSWIKALALQEAQKPMKNESNALKLQMETLTKSVQALVPQNDKPKQLKEQGEREGQPELTSCSCSDPQMLFLLGKVQSLEEEMASKIDGLNRLNVQVLKLTQAVVEGLTTQNEKLASNDKNIKRSRKDLLRDAQSNAGQQEPQRTGSEQPQSCVGRNASVSSRHVQQQGAFRCPQCEKRFSGKVILYQHVHVVHGKKEHACIFCEKRFSQRGNLETHLRTHTGERPYNCRICNKEFSQRSYLKIHLRVHSGERPYKCDLCKKAFTQISNMKRHQREHCRSK